MVQCILARHNMYYNMVKSLQYKNNYNELTQPKKYKKYVNIEIQKHRITKKIENKNFFSHIKYIWNIFLKTLTIPIHLKK